jgi:glutaredoxin
MRIEILHISGCPHTAGAAQRVHEALSVVGLDHEDVDLTLVSSRADAARIQFAGSPTILIDGVDAFPSGIRTMELACRVYATPEGLAGLPTVSQIVEVLERTTSTRATTP